MMKSENSEKRNLLKMKGKIETENLFLFTFCINPYLQLIIISIFSCIWKYFCIEQDMQDTAGEARTSSIVMYSYGLPHMAEQKQDDQLEHTYSSYVRIWDVALKICQRRWTIGRSGERESGISVLAARHDDDDMHIHVNMIIYILMK